MPLLLALIPTTYTTSGAYAASSKMLTITAPTTDFNYGGDTVFCQGGVNPVATIAGDTAGVLCLGFWVSNEFPYG